MQAGANFEPQADQRSYKPATTAIRRFRDSQVIFLLTLRWETAETFYRSSYYVEVNATLEGGSMTVPPHQLQTTNVQLLINFN
jgi:hypothetical protein